LNSNQLRELSDEELALRIRDTRKELFNLRFQHATGQLDNPHKLSAVRRDIARLLTVRHERESDREREAATAGGEA